MPSRRIQSGTENILCRVVEYTNLWTPPSVYFITHSIRSFKFDVCHRQYLILWSNKPKTKALVTRSLFVINIIVALSSGGVSFSDPCPSFSRTSPVPTPCSFHKPSPSINVNYSRMLSLLQIHSLLLQQPYTTISLCSIGAESEPRILTFLY